MTRIYEQLNTKTLGDVEAIDIQALQDKVHIQEINKQELETYNLINKAAMRDGLPIPESGKVVTTGFLDDTGTVVVFRPDKGEVYTLMAMSLDPNGSNAAHRGIGYLVDVSTLSNPADPTNLSGANFVEIFDATLSTSAESLTYDTPLFIDNNLMFALNVVTLDTAAGDLLALKIAMLRVR